MRIVFQRAERVVIRLLQVEQRRTFVGVILVVAADGVDRDVGSDYRVHRGFPVVEHLGVAQRGKSVGGVAVDLVAAAQHQVRAQFSDFGGDGGKHGADASGRVVAATSVTHDDERPGFSLLGDEDFGGIAARVLNPGNGGPDGGDVQRGGDVADGGGIEGHLVFCGTVPEHDLPGGVVYQLAVGDLAGAEGRTLAVVVHFHMSCPVPIADVNAVLDIGNFAVIQGRCCARGVNVHALGAIPIPHAAADAAAEVGNLAVIKGAGPGVEGGVLPGVPHLVCGTIPVLEVEGIAGDVVSPCHSAGVEGWLADGAFGGDFNGVGAVPIVDAVGALPRDRSVVERAAAAGQAGGGGEVGDVLAVPKVEVAPVAIHARPQDAAVLSADAGFDAAVGGKLADLPGSGWAGGYGHSQKPGKEEN